MFEKHCQICGTDVKKETVVKRFGKFFCNDIHAQEYLKKKEEYEKRKLKNFANAMGTMYHHGIILDPFCM
ncbi:MAG TPA: hypothetical protein VD699_03055 [Nitrosopumilaceae archaeon]|nr:hypothetical protein [Nitrosopumilaceae archaeon]